MFSFPMFVLGVLSLLAGLACTVYLTMLFFIRCIRFPLDKTKVFYHPRNRQYFCYLTVKRSGTIEVDFYRKATRIFPVIGYNYGNMLKNTKIQFGSWNSSGGSPEAAVADAMQWVENMFVSVDKPEAERRLAWSLLSKAKKASFIKNMVYLKNGKPTPHPSENPGPSAGQTLTNSRV